MVNQLNIPCQHVYAVGDIHGFFNELAFTIRNYELHDDMIIVCGDCGLYFRTPEAGKQEMRKLNNVCQKHNVRLVLVRGNHDDPEYYRSGLANTKWITAVPDYTVINGHILCVGGAISVDRVDRMETEELNVRHYMKYHRGVDIEEACRKITHCVWPDEAPVYDGDAICELKPNGICIEHVITHTAPAFCDPHTKDGLKYWVEKDPGLIESVTEERLTMNQIYDKLVAEGHPLKSWTYGHFHRHCMQEYDGIRFTMLDCIGVGSTKADWIQIVDYTQNNSEKN